MVGCATKYLHIRLIGQQKLVEYLRIKFGLLHISSNCSVVPKILQSEISNLKDVVRRPLGVSAPGGAVCIPRAIQKVGCIVGQAAQQLCDDMSITALLPVVFIFNVDKVSPKKPFPTMIG